MTIICPKCSLNQNDSVAICDCGFDLVAYRRQQQRLRQSRRIEQAPYRRLQTWKLVLWVFSGICILGGFGSAIGLLSTSDSLWIPVGVAMAGVTAAVPYIVGAEVLAFLLRLGGQMDDIAAGMVKPEETTK